MDGYLQGSRLQTSLRDVPPTRHPRVPKARALAYFLLARWLFPGTSFLHFVSRLCRRDLTGERWLDHGGWCIPGGTYRAQEFYTTESAKHPCVNADSRAPPRPTYLFMGWGPRVTWCLGFRLIHKALEAKKARAPGTCYCAM